MSFRLQEYQPATKKRRAVWRTVATVNFNPVSAHETEVLENDQLRRVNASMRRALLAGNAPAWADATAWLCLATSPRFQQMLVCDAVAEMVTNGVVLAPRREAARPNADLLDTIVDIARSQP